MFVSIIHILPPICIYRHVKAGTNMLVRLSTFCSSCNPSYVLISSSESIDWIIFFISILVLRYLETPTFGGWQWISNSIKLSDKQVNHQPKRPKFNKHMSGVVYCDNHFNWVLAPLHPGGSWRSPLHSQMSRSAISHCDLAVRHTHSTSQELH